MGMFDQIRVLHIDKKGFNQEHNGLEFQTKDLESLLDSYAIFNNRLYFYQNNEEKKAKVLVEQYYSGNLSFYTMYPDGKITYWVQYDCILVNGFIEKIVDKTRVISDNRCIELDNPSLYPIMVTISLNQVPKDKVEKFLSLDKDKVISDIRKAVGDDNVSVRLPVKSDRTPGYRLIHCSQQNKASESDNVSDSADD